MSTLILPCPSTHPDLYHGKYVAGLFANGEQGVWYDPSDFSTMFQDAAGTTPVTAVDQPVGRILDKSGRGNHATQTTVPKRPILKIDGNGKYYLKFDGVDDWLVTPSIDFTAINNISVFAGVRKLSDAARGIIVEQLRLGTGGATSFGLSGPQRNSATTYAAFTDAVSLANVAAPSTNVLTGLYAPKELIAQTALKVNGGVEIVANTLVVSSVVNQPIYIGSRAGTSLPFNGHLYSLIVRGAQSSEAQILSAETYCNQKTGAY